MTISYKKKLLTLVTASLIASNFVFADTKTTTTTKESILQIDLAELEKEAKKRGVTAAEWTSMVNNLTDGHISPSDLLQLAVNGVSTVLDPVGSVSGAAMAVAGATVNSIYEEEKEEAEIALAMAQEKFKYTNGIINDIKLGFQVEPIKTCAVLALGSILFAATSKGIANVGIYVTDCKSERMLKYATPLSAASLAAFLLALDYYKTRADKEQFQNTSTPDTTTTNITTTDTTTTIQN